MFSAEARDIIGGRIVSMDLDTVITGDLTSLFTREEDFVIWGGRAAQPKTRIPFCWYNGSLMMLRAGTRTKVWDTFDPKRSPQEAHRANARGSDQGWIAFCLGEKEATWGESDGVFSYRSHIIPNQGKLPSSARLVAFHGNHDPWQPEVQRVAPWIREYYW
jgi:hypothetical protein